MTRTLPVSAMLPLSLLMMCLHGRLGRAFAIVPPSWQPRGYVDIADDDYTAEKHWLGSVFERVQVPSQLAGSHSETQ